MQLSEILNERRNICSVALSNFNGLEKISVVSDRQEHLRPTQFPHLWKALRSQASDFKVLTALLCQAHANKQQNKLFIIQVISKTLPQWWLWGANTILTALIKFSLEKIYISFLMKNTETTPSNDRYDFEVSKYSVSKWFGFRFSYV